MYSVGTNLDFEIVQKDGYTIFSEISKYILNRTSSLDINWPNELRTTPPDKFNILPYLLSKNPLVQHICFI